LKGVKPSGPVGENLNRIDVRRLAAEEKAEP
jgi:hypothetical protein